jgi:hypothetical protein
VPIVAEPQNNLPAGIARDVVHPRATTAPQKLAE